MYLRMFKQIVQINKYYSRFDLPLQPFTQYISLFTIHDPVLRDSLFS